MSTATTPARRPALTAKGAATRTRIVEAAATLVRQHGAARTSIDEVRAEARVSASQLYHYFGDKKELVRAVVAHEAAIAVAEQQPQLGAIGSLGGIGLPGGIEALRSWRDAVVAQAHHRGPHGWSPLGSLASELVDTDSDARAELIAGFDLWLAPVESGLASMRESGALRDDADTRGLALGLLAALQGGLLVARLQEQIAPLEEALDAAIARIESFTAGSPAQGVALAQAPKAGNTGAAPRQPLAPAVRRTPASPARAFASAPAPASASEPASASGPRTPMRPRRPLAR